MGIVIEGKEPQDHRSKTIPVELVGHQYAVNRIKTATAVKVARAVQNSNEDDMITVLDAIEELIDKMFSKKDATAIRKRLEDPTDVLDYNHISQLMQAVLQAAGGEENPTG